VKKLYRVMVEINFDMMCLADSREEANKIARYNYRHEPAFDDGPSFCAVEVRMKDQIKGFEGTLPWSDDRDDDRTVDEVAAEIFEAEKAEAEERAFRAKQIPIPGTE